MSVTIWSTMTQVVNHTPFVCSCKLFFRSLLGVYNTVNWKRLFVMGQSSIRISLMVSLISDNQLFSLNCSFLVCYFFDQLFYLSGDLCSSFMIFRPTTFRTLFKISTVNTLRRPCFPETSTWVGIEMKNFFKLIFVLGRWRNNLVRFQ